MKKKYILCFFILLAILSGSIVFCAEKDKKEDDNYKKAVKYFYQKKLEMAEVLFQEELKTNPENSLAYSYLGDIFFEKKKYDGKKLKCGKRTYFFDIHEAK